MRSSLGGAAARDGGGEACHRIFWERCCFSRSVSPEQALDLVVQHVRAIHCSGEMAYVGVSENPHRRFHDMTPCNFPHYRAMRVVASGDGSRIASLEMMAFAAMSDTRPGACKLPC